MSKDREKKEGISSKSATLVLPDVVYVKLGRAAMWGLPGYGDARNGLELTMSDPGPKQIITKDLTDAQKFILSESLKTESVVEQDSELCLPKSEEYLAKLITGKDIEALRREIRLLVSEANYQTISSLIALEVDKPMEHRNQAAMIVLRQALQSITNDPKIKNNPGKMNEIAVTLKMMGIRHFPTQYVVRPSEKAAEKAKAKG